jgi:hypothetical protein
MRVIVDVDCVVADLIGAILDINGIEDRTIASEWDWFKRYTNPDDTAKVRKALTNPNFWETLPLIPNALEGIDFLRTNEHQIIWCTAPYEQCFGWLDARRKWLNNIFQADKYKDPLVPTEDKYLVRGTAMIDDRHDLVKAWEKAYRKGVGYVYRTEMNLNSGIELVTWEDIMKNKFFQKKEQ